MQTTLQESINIKEMGVKLTNLKETREGAFEIIAVGKQEKRKEVINKI